MNAVKERPKKKVVAMELPELTLNDRCDGPSCNAEALTRITMPVPTKKVFVALNGPTKKAFMSSKGQEEYPNSVGFPETYDLLLCGHHTNRYEMKLVAAEGEFHRKVVEVVNRLQGSDH